MIELHDTHGDDAHKHIDPSRGPGSPGWPWMSGGAATAVLMVSLLIFPVVYFVMKFALFLSREGNQFLVYIVMCVVVLGLLAGFSVKWFIRVRKEYSGEAVGAGVALIVLAIMLCVCILWPSWIVAQDGVRPTKRLDSGPYVEAPVDETGVGHLITERQNHY